MKLAILGLLCALSTLPHASAAAQDREAATDRVLNAWIARADRWVERGRTRAAERLLRRAVERAPADPRAPLRLFALEVPQSPAGAAEPSDGAREAAREVAERLGAAHPDPDSPDRAAVARDLRLARQWAIAVAGDHREAIEAVALAAPRHDAPHADALRRLAALAVRRHDLRAADDALDAARRVDPVDPALLVDHASVRLARGHTDEAVAMLEEALQRRPESEAVRRDLAGALLAAGRSHEAVDVLAVLATDRPDDVALRVDLSRAALAAGDAARAERAARDALERADETDPAPAIALGMALTALERPDEARQALREALRRAPHSERARAALRGLDERR